MADVLVEGFAADAVGLAGLLAARGERVRLAGPDAASPAARALGALGVRVEGGVDLDSDRETPERAYLDVWTPEVAPRVVRLRAAGTILTSLSDLLLAESPLPTVGVTGTAGKSTTTAFLAGVLRWAGVVAHAGTTARPGQRWATEELLPLLGGPADGVMLLELTSSHLAFCTAAPHVAVVTCFWPDHVELHGSVAAYRAAKERIVLGQSSGDRVVYDADDVRVSGFADLTPAARFPFSLQGSLERGAFLRGADAVVRLDGVETVVGRVPSLAGGRARAALAALAAALAVGVEPERLDGSLADLDELPHRARVIGELDGTSLVDDSAAATAAKAVATLREHPQGSVVAVVGGALESVGLVVQASREERRLLEEALDVLARTARVVLVFGSAGSSLVGPLRRRSVSVVEADTLERALALGLESCKGASALVVSPMFPLAQTDRALVEQLLRRALTGDPERSVRE